MLAGAFAEIGMAYSRFLLSPGFSFAVSQLAGFNLLQYHYSFGTATLCEITYNSLLPEPKDLLID